MVNKIHILKENRNDILRYKKLGWLECGYVGDLLEMQEPQQQRAVREIQTMLTKLKSGIKGALKWKS